MFLIVTGFIGYSYINSDLSSALTLNISNEVCIQENLNDRLNCLATPDHLKSKYVSNITGVTFSNNSDTNGKGIYMLSNTIGSTYPMIYYRGDVSNNNLKYGGFCWKRVRTTDTGGTKLIYNGTPNESGYCSGDNPFIDTSAFNTLDNSISYAGYTYNLADNVHETPMDSTYLFSDSYTYTEGVGFELDNPITISDTSEISTKHYTCVNDTGSCSELSFVTFANTSTLYNVKFTTNDTIESFIQRSKGNNTNSTIKEVVDDWYLNNLTNKGYLEGTIFCGDRSNNTLGNDTSYLNSGWQTTDADIANYLYYSSYGRLNISSLPSLTCSTADSYSIVSNTNGNGYLTNSIALLSLDDVILAGGTLSENQNYYLKSNSPYWTMSPKSFNNVDMEIYGVNSDGAISGVVASQDIGVRPSVSLRKEVIITGGDGAVDNPYTVDLPFNPSDITTTFPTRFTLTYDDTTLTLDATLNTAGGWEYVIKPLSVKKGKNYRISLDYTITSNYKQYSTYEGIGLQVVDVDSSVLSTMTNDSVGALRAHELAVKYMSRTAGTYSETLDFTASDNNSFVLNCGMAADNQTINFKISNFSIREI